MKKKTLLLLAVLLCCLAAVYFTRPSNGRILLRQTDEMTLYVRNKPLQRRCGREGAPYLSGKDGSFVQVTDPELIQSFKDFLPLITPCQENAAGSPETAYGKFDVELFVRTPKDSRIFCFTGTDYFRNFLPTREGGYIYSGKWVYTAPEEDSAALVALFENYDNGGEFLTLRMIPY